APDVQGLSLKMEIIGPIGKYPRGEILLRLSKNCCNYGERHERRRCCGYRRLRRRGGGVGRSEGCCGCRSRSDGNRKGDARSPQHEPAAGVRLPRLCLARSETYLVVRVLRERSQSRLMGGDGETDHAGVL